MTNITKEYYAILESELEESMIKKIAATALIAGSAMLAHHAIERNNEVAAPATQAEVQPKKDPSREEMITHITSNYKVKQDTAEEIVDAAIKHAKPTYPKAHDIVAIAGVESSFNPSAKSNLKFDAARGVMQVRARVNGIDPKEMSTVDGQVKHGVSILHQYHQKLGNVEDSLHAFNVGITNHTRGKNPNWKYVDKVKKELARFAK